MSDDTVMREIIGSAQTATALIKQISDEIRDKMRTQLRRGDINITYVYTELVSMCAMLDRSVAETTFIEGMAKTVGALDFQPQLPLEKADPYSERS